MDRRNARLVRESFDDLTPIADRVPDLFYDRLFEIDPGTRSLFPEDMSEQKKKLMLMLATAVYGLRDIYGLLPAVQDLGRRHAGYAVTDAHYDSVGQALLHALHIGLGPKFTAEVKAAWIEVYTFLAIVMKDAQRKVA